MKAVVLGGGGLTGRCTVRDLARGGRFERIVVGDVDLDLARAAAKATGTKGVTAEKVDARDPNSLARALAAADVCVNAVQYTFHLEVMEGCLEAGVPYLDFGGLFHMTRRQLEWDGKYRKKNLLAIPGLGQVPGASNVLAAEATADLDTVESIVIRDGWRDFTEGGPEVLFTWSPSTFLDEMEKPAVVWEEGAYREHPAMSAPEEFDFASPVGKTRVYRTLHSEPATLPESLAAKGVRHVEWKEGGPGIDVLRTMSLLGLGSSRALKVRDATVVPRDFTLALLKREKLLGIPPGVKVNDWEVCDLEIHGTKQRKPVLRHAQVRFPPKPEWGLSTTEYAVGVCGAIGAEMIVDGTIRATGVVPPERCVPGKAFRAALAERGIVTAIVPPEPPLPPVDPRSALAGTM